MEKLNSSPETIPAESPVVMSRLTNLSDGVFAIALTLLAFDIRLPDGVPIGDLPHSLLQLAPKILVFIISFVVIGGAWGSHQRMLKQINRGDGLLVWFNLSCLLFIALLPAGAALLGRYPDAFLAIACFALDGALIQLTTLGLWRHASRNGLINPALDRRVVKSIGRRLNLSTAIFLFSIPLALLSIWITYLSWIGLFVLIFTTDWLTWQLAAMKQQTTFPLDHARRGSISIQHELGNLKIDSNAGDHILVDGVFGGGLVSSEDRAEDAAAIRLSVPERQGLLSWRYPWSWGPIDSLDWTLHLSDRIPLVLEIEATNGEAELDLGGLQITDLKIKSNTTITQVSLPDREGQTTVTIEARTARITLRVPPDASASIHNNMAQGKVEVDPDRFPTIEMDREYRSANYETAMKCLDIRIEGPMSSVKIV